ncbi:unnamed protein product [Leptosia nina]|uniref:C2H2-type domain-containing protein n=1 Tax=Leptosia nina TaxID=320188 RepID=A0AAV1JZV6_9NEOP
MNKNIDVSYICELCLSKDRVVTSHCDEIFEVYKELLGNDVSRFLLEKSENNITSNAMQKINVCWECKCVLSKIIKFKEQIKIAQSNWLQKSFTTLSSLKYTNNLILDCVNPEDIKDTTIIKNEEIYQYNKRPTDCTFSLNVPRQENSINETLHVNYDDVKVDVFCHQYNHTDNFDTFDEDLHNFNLDTKAMKTVDEFNESDDEPLTKKKTKQKEKKSKEEKRRERESGVVINPRVMKKLQQLNVTSDHLEMVMLSWDEVESERKQSVATEKFTRHAHKCYQCVVGFNHRCKLEEHMKKHKQSPGSAECEVCHIFCKDQPALASHRRRHRVRWRCRKCGGSWSRASVAADHVFKHHGAPAPTHSCTMCDVTTVTLGKLRNHIRKSHSTQHKCDLCGKVFRDKTSLRTHLFIHRGVKEYSCPKCEKQFLFKKAMEIHLVTHDSPANMYCHECDVTFKNQMSYNQHMKYNLKHIDPARLKYACTLCEKKFVKAARLQEHNMAVHLKITPIQCPITGCQFACSSRSVLRTHRRVAHGRAVQKRDHVCDMCGKAYTTKKSLEGHLRTHSGERPFHCAKCPAAFGYEAALYNHNKLVHLKHKVNRNRVTHTNWPVDVSNVE